MSDFICGHRILAGMIKQAKIRIVRIEKDFPINELDNKNWRIADEIIVEKYWSNEIAPNGRHFKAKLLWSDAALYIRFCANQTEPLTVSAAPNLKTKTVGLWERDVCEIFVAPDFNKPQKYFEFEIAPTGEWVDLAIEIFSNEKRETDFQYNSGMKSAAKIEKEKILSAIKIGWKAFGKTPNAGDIWKGNLFRCVGAGSTRGYLAWQPTKTAEPNFHAPGAFGEFEFVK
jgi:hypothetical protein